MARDATKTEEDAAETEPASNLTHDTFLQAVSEITEIAEEKAAVHERWKRCRKKWKAEGVELGQLDAALKMTDWGRNEVREHFDTAKRYAQWLNLPIGSQPDLFEGKSEEQVSEDEWFARGVTEGLKGGAAEPPDECPGEHHQAYMNGFAQGQKKLAEAIPKSKPDRDVEKAA